MMLLPEPVSEETVVEIAGIALDVGQAMISATTGDYWGVTTSLLGEMAVILTGPFALLKVDNALEEMNEGLIAQEFLFNYYKYGSDYFKYGESLGLTQGATLEDYIDAIANKLELTNGWFTKDYNPERAISLINNFNLYMVEPATQACLAGKCNVL